MRISFDQLADRIARPSFSLKPKARLQVPSAPDPFVPPDLLVIEGGLGAEVIFVKAPAAVGKTTMARALSARTGALLLDLAQIPVSTHSLVGLLKLDFVGPGDPVEAFHNGQIPLIIDALDEGRLLSSEKGFEQFLETTGELLHESRHETSRPKLVFLGRPEAIDLAGDGLQLGGEGFTRASLNVDFFGEGAARQLIDGYARAAARADAAYWLHPEPVRRVIDAYFEAIGTALGLVGTLWSEDRGRAFAGYAPVLAALGSTIAELDNFVEVKNQLLAVGGTQRAWSVIETVLKAILDREKGKLTEQLKKHISVGLPPEAYDDYEQLTLLTQLIHGRSTVGSGRVQLPTADQVVYHSMVDRYLPEHPFVRLGEPANAVFGSVILAHAVYNDLLQGTDLAILGQTSRQPFLWRSLRGELERGSALLDGRYVGCILNSFWNEPMREDAKVIIRSTIEESEARVFVPSARGALTIEVALPIWLFGQVHPCSIDIDGDLEIHGQTIGNAGAAFFMRGPVDISCSSLKVEADVVSFESSSWLEAGSVTSRPRLNLHLKAGGSVGWGGILKATYPWNRLPSTVGPPKPPPGDVLEALTDECWRRLPGGAAITLLTDYSNPGDDRLRWTERYFPEAFPKLIELMLSHGLASKEKMSAKGERKVRVRFETSWETVRRAIRGEDTSGTYTPFVKAARNSIG